MSATKEGIKSLRVLFDGECGLCAGVVRFLYARERRVRFVFTPFQSPLGEALAHDLGLDPRDPASFAVIDDDGHARLKSHAMFHALASCRQPWPALAVLARMLPRVLTDAVYDGVARRRIAWFGRSDVCQRPEPELAGRLELGR